ncbi:polysaccharide deacetylase family protein [Desulforamulus profundi]|uniref:polysaccharide deacetylase family protein n=1 Tax=Desulforamulus profundi TaxID=1383067 RepID=UPI001A9A62EE|nr:polysaccharide deacetylase family protein [Desulforamulus profundi]
MAAQRAGREAGQHLKKVVALTFDDGPSATFTPQVLDILREHQAGATFFVVGKRAEKYPELIRRMAQEGHEIGNHTFNHPMSPVKPARLAEELDKTDEVIYRLTDRHTQYFRPPGGKCTIATVEPALDKGYKVILWTAREDPKDWADPGAKKSLTGWSTMQGTAPSSFCTTAAATAPRRWRLCRKSCRD